MVSGRLEINTERFENFSVIFTWEFKNKVTLHTNFVETKQRRKWFTDKSWKRKEKKIVKLNSRTHGVNIGVNDDALSAAHDTKYMFDFAVSRGHIAHNGFLKWYSNTTSITVSYMKIFMCKTILWGEKSVFFITNWKRNMICTWGKDQKKKKKSLTRAEIKNISKSRESHAMLRYWYFRQVLETHNHSTARLSQRVAREKKKVENPSICSKKGYSRESNRSTHQTFKRKTHADIKPYLKMPNMKTIEFDNNSKQIFVLNQTVAERKREWQRSEGDEDRKWATIHLIWMIHGYRFVYFEDGDGDWLLSYSFYVRFISFLVRRTACTHIHELNLLHVQRLFSVHDSRLCLNLKPSTFYTYIQFSFVCLESIWK